jgi:hypothetical protein
MIGSELGDVLLAPYNQGRIKIELNPEILKSDLLQSE